MKYLIALIICTGLFACGSGGGSGAASVDLSAYKTESSGEVTRAYKTDSNGELMEDGFVSNGTKNGPWTIYDPQTRRIKSISTYSNGTLNGPHLEFSNRGQIETRIHYLNNEYNGMYATFKNGRAVKEMAYKNGVIHGEVREFTSRGKIQKSTQFKDGKIHGDMIFYDDEENVVMQYKYENGDKLSGGIIEKN